MINAPQEIHDAHAEVVRCVQQTTEYIHETELSINSDFYYVTYPDEDPCELLETSLDEIGEYVQQNKLP